VDAGKSEGKRQRAKGKSTETPRFLHKSQGSLRSTRPAVASLLAAAEAELTAHGISTPRLDAEVLLAHALEVDRAGLYARLYDPLPPGRVAAFHRLLARRARHEPLQYLTGVQEFWSLAFRVDQRVLIPRPETEVVVETALRLLGKVENFCSLLHAPRSYAPRAGRVRLLDIGTGSGCIAIALATELSQAEVWAVDTSRDALAVARENAERHRVAGRIRFLHGNLFTPLAGEEGGFDLIVSNPPYIARDDLAALQPEVQDWEPRSALAGGVDGLDFYRRLLSEGPAYLRSGGWLVMEMGQGQGSEVLRLIGERRDLSAGSGVLDYAGRERVAVARKGATRVG